MHSSAKVRNYPLTSRICIIGISWSANGHYPRKAKKFNFANVANGVRAEVGAWAPGI
jgi:hypothetical protein